jgi:nucleotide-binding universal stress UspA family protein
MDGRVLVAIDQREARCSVIEFAARLSSGPSAAVRVFHGIEYVGRGCAAPLETRQEAEMVVEEAVFDLRMSGVGASGSVRPCFNRDIGRMIVAEAAGWRADMIVVGGRRGRGPGRVFGHGIRERVLRRSPIPVVVAPLLAVGSGRPGQDHPGLR